MVGEFFSSNIDEDEQDDGKEHDIPDKFVGQIANHKIVQLENNYIPRGLIPLEKLIDQKNVTLKRLLNPSVEEVQNVNIGTI